MKIRYLQALSLAITAGGLGLLSGCVVEPNGRMAFQPFVVVAPQPVVYAAPVPVEVAPAMIPDSYAWDGYEYVGLVGDQYYYLGPDNLWLFCDPIRLGRFHGWDGTALMRPAASQRCG